MFSTAFEITKNWELKIMKIKAVKNVTHLAVLTVHMFLVFNGKYKAKHFSTDIMTSNADENSWKK